MKLIYLKSVLKCDSFDVAIDIKIQFFRVLVTIEPGRSLLQFVTTNCLIQQLLLQGQSAVHRHDITARVFRQKLKSLINYIVKLEVFGSVQFLGI